MVRWLPIQVREKEKLDWEGYEHEHKHTYLIGKVNLPTIEKLVQTISESFLPSPSLNQLFQDVAPYQSLSEGIDFARPFGEASRRGGIYRPIEEPSLNVSLSFIG